MPVKRILMASFVCCASYGALAQNAPQSYIVSVDKDIFASESDQAVEPDARAQRQPAIWSINHNPKMHRLLLRWETQHGFKASNLYSHAINGFAATLNDKQVAALSAIRGVRIEKDKTMKPGAIWSDNYWSGPQIVPWGIYAIRANESSAHSGATTQTLAFNRTRIYVIDSGMPANHPDLNVESRVNFGGDNNLDDCLPHGTEMAGIAAAKNNGLGMAGVAPGAPIVSVKITTGCAIGNLVSTSTVLSATDWVYRQEVNYYDTIPGYAGGVVNFSFSGDRNFMVGTAFEGLAKAGPAFKQIAWGPAVFKTIQYGGVFSALIAGNNDGKDACNYDPGYAGRTISGAVTVGAMTADATMASFSNIGQCVEMWAPGVSIMATTPSAYGYGTDQGTSMAAPFVAGIAALIRQKMGYMTAAQVENKMKEPQNMILNGTVFMPQANNF